MNDTKRLLDSIKSKILFEPIDDRVLIKPMKYKMLKKTFKVPVKEDLSLSNAEETVVETKDETREVPANCQLGVVLKIGVSAGSTKPYEEGDIVVYPLNAGVAFELFKDSRLLKRYEILGIWSTPVTQS